MKIPSVDSFFNSLSDNGVNNLVFVSATCNNKKRECFKDVAIKESISDGCDAYFYVNPRTTGPGSTVTHLSCNFIDIDAGRDVNGDYFKEFIIKKFKKRVAKKLREDAELRPTYVVETRNGYHCYWVYENNNPIYNNSISREHFINQWDDIQTRMIINFKSLGADGWVSDIKQLLRVPGSNWNKKWCGKYKPFKVRLTSIGKASKRYTMLELNTILYKKLIVMKNLESLRNKSVSKNKRNLNVMKTSTAISKTEDASIVFDAAKYFRSNNMTNMAERLEIIADKL